MTFNPLANDTDVDGTLDSSTVIFINPPAGATLSPDGKTLTVPGEGVYTVLPIGEITFSPAAGICWYDDVGDVPSSRQRRRDATSANILISVNEIQ
ncbi:MAG: hypothetical protein R3C28_31195 [Pirellulaceae bacterium]